MTDQKSKESSIFPAKNNRFLANKTLEQAKRELRPLHSDWLMPCGGHKSFDRVE